MKEATLIYPHQLFENHPAAKKDRPIYLVEDPHFFTRYRFHKQKLAFHKATLLEYKDHLKRKGYQVRYTLLTDNLFKQLKQKGIEHLHSCLVYDHVLEKSLKQKCRKANIELTFYESPYFMSSHEQFDEQFSGKESFYFTSFYHAQRKRFNILMVHGKPLGGKYSYDLENRLKLPAHISVPPLPKISLRPSIKKAQAWAQGFENHPGSVDTWYYPVTFTSAKRWLTSFFKERFTDFGPYQDALDTDRSALFHSVLSPLLNIGLLTPKYVVKKAIEFGQDNQIPLNSLEGFIRQVVGWREFVYGVYHAQGREQQKTNFFQHTNKLPQSFWTGTTDIKPIDILIKRILHTGYAHHIERLMVLGNFMLLCNIDPDDVYLWFMELFIDAYDWVMIPNVYGMSQYADGGLMTTKPYFSGSNYIKKMSNYPKGPWEDVFDDLFWNFLATHQKKLAPIPRMRFMLSLLKKKDPKKLKEHKSGASAFLKEFLIS